MRQCRVQIVPRILVLAALAGALVAPVPAAAAAAAGEPLAALAAGGDAVTWQTAAAWDRLVLTVSTPDGAVMRREARDASSVSMSLFDDAGQHLADGPYVWELRALPAIDATTRRVLAAARAAGDDSVAAELRAAGKLPASEVASGSFRVAGGVAVLAGDAEAAGSSAAAGGGLASVSAPALTPVFAADQVIPDDLIVQGSICVGFDCVNNESFGFDTIRLKENNLRIKFEDTSTTPGFPTRDWQLTANDSASGGADKFSIEDISAARIPFTVRGNAPNNSLFVDSAGRLGIKTGTPVLDLHVVNGNSPGIRLEQDGSSGFTPQTWDIAGNETNFFVRDVTGGSRLSLRIQPGAPSSSLFIKSNGDLGVGTSSPSAPVHVLRAAATTGNAAFILQNNTGTVPSLWFFQNQNTNGAFVVTDQANGTQAAFKLFPANPENALVIRNNRIGLGVVNPGQNIEHSSGATLTGATWTNGSSRQSKTDIAELGADEALAAVAGLVPVRFRYKPEVDSTGEEFVGFIAEDVPELLAMSDHKGLSPMDIVAALTKVVQEQQRVVETQRQENAELAARLARVEALVGAAPAP